MSDVPEKQNESLFAVPDTVISGGLTSIDEVAPFTRDDWNRAMKAMKSVKVSCDVQITEYGRQFVESIASSFREAQNREITHGDLGDHAAVWHDESWGQDQIAIRAKGEVRVHLDPGQFLRLLDWGATHRAAIEQLAKEQEEWTSVVLRHLWMRFALLA